MLAVILINIAVLLGVKRIGRYGITRMGEPYEDEILVLKDGKYCTHCQYMDDYIRTEIWLAKNRVRAIFDRNDDIPF